jgi:formate hydrogenlyase transcriptional activator
MHLNATLRSARFAPAFVPLEEPSPDVVLYEGIIGQSAALRHVLQQIRQVALTDATVLICGETGTGKERFAHAVHNLSGRRGQAFVKFNCAAIPATLLESDLFGHERGAFTGAVAQRIGRFEAANRGTLFLDEIGEAPLEMQPKLLRVLQEREFERVGSTRILTTDVRLVAATNANLREMVHAKRFRADLFYRLNVFPIQVPPLRNRRADIPSLVAYFADLCAKRMRRRIARVAASTMDALVEYSWPGNIRELQNLVERAVILSSGDVLEVPLGDIDDATHCQRSAETLQEVEKEHITATLRDTNWVVSGRRGAASRLGLNRSTLLFRMKKLGIERPADSYGDLELAASR